MTPTERLAHATRALIRHLRDPELDHLALFAAAHRQGFSPDFAARAAAIVAEAEAALAALEEERMIPRGV